MIEKAMTDSSGIVRKPNHSMTVCEHGTPCLQGATRSGTIPATRSMWKTARNRPTPTSGSTDRTTFRSNGKRANGRIRASGNMKIR